MHDNDHQVPVQVNGYDLVGALDMLAQLESEQTGQRKQFLQVGLFLHSKLSTQVVLVKLGSSQVEIS